MRYLDIALLLSGSLFFARAQQSQNSHPIAPAVSLSVLGLTSDACPTTPPCLIIQLHNNLKQGIIVSGYLNPRDSGKRYTGVEDEVVQDAAEPGIEPPSGLLLADEKARPFLSAFELPNREAQQREAIRRSEVKSSVTSPVPHGFNSGIQPGITKMLYVAPGNLLMFKLPSNHVGPFWHIEIPFHPVTETNAVAQSAILFRADVPTRSTE